MTAKDALSPLSAHMAVNALPQVESTLPLGALIDMMVGRGLEAVAVADVSTPDGAPHTLGVVDRDSLLMACARLFPQLQESTELTIACPPSQYSASAIAHAVEDADAHLLNLNVTEGTQPNTLTTVELRVNHSRGQSVARSLSRYGYDTITIAPRSGSAAVTDVTASRARELLHLLEI